MDDNACPRRTPLDDDFLKREVIRWIDWQSRSPDLNPIENVSDNLERVNVIHNLPPRTIQGLKTALLNIYAYVDQELIKYLMSTMKS